MALRISTATSMNRDITYGLHNPTIVGASFSRTHSALENAIAAIKALLREDEAMAAALVSSGFQSIVLPIKDMNTHERLVQLFEAIYDADENMADFAMEVRNLYREAFPIAWKIR